MIDLDALKARLAEYDDYAPKCPKKVARTINCDPDWLPSDDTIYSEYLIVTYSPCCRPEGHAGECRNGRPILGWPGFVTMSALVAEVERLRAENAALVQTSADLCPACGWRFLVPGDGCLNCEVADLRMQRDEHMLDNQHAYDEGFDVGTRRGYEAERAAVVAWLRAKADTDRWVVTATAYHLAADAIERGEHRREENEP